MRIQPLRSEELLKKAKELIKPIHGRDGILYPISTTLTDGTILPCVVIQDSEPHLKLALRRFEKARNNSELHESMGYKSIVKNFVCSGNKINYYDICSIQPSPYALSEERLKEIKGETSMGWTEFTVRMHDGKEFLFGTSFDIFFFDMPQGYIAKNIKSIIPSEVGKPKFAGNGEVYREKPFFTCFI